MRPDGLVSPCIGSLANFVTRGIIKVTLGHDHARSVASQRLVRLLERTRSTKERRALLCSYWGRYGTGRVLPKNVAHLSLPVACGGGFAGVVHHRMSRMTHSSMSMHGRYPLVASLVNRMRFDPAYGHTALLLRAGLTRRGSPSRPAAYLRRALRELHRTKRGVSSQKAT